MYDLIVIGAGPGGYEAAALAGRMGKKVTLIEKEYMGGTCLNVGCIPSKTFLKSAHVCAEIKDSSLYGVSTTALKLDFTELQKRKKSVVETLTKGVEGMLKKARVEVVKGKASILEPGKVGVNGSTYETHHILIATGSEPEVVPIKGIDSDTVVDSTGILETKAAPESLVVIGGGIIGLEFASFFIHVGTKVTVVEMLPGIGAGMDSEIMKKLQLSLKKDGVIFQLSSTVSEIEGNVVHFTDEKDQEQKVKGTIILNATGRRPVTKGIGLETIGVEISRKGIVTSEEGKTNIPGVWACGDVTGRCLLAHAATREGIVAVKNMFGKRDRMRYKAIPSVVYTNPEVAGVGKSEDQLKEEEIPYKKSTMPMGVAGRFLVENAGKSGTVKVLTGEEYGEILGVHMIGGVCSEMIYGAAMMVEMEMRVEDLAEIVFPHPTVSEALKETILHS